MNGKFTEANPGEIFDNSKTSLSNARDYGRLFKQTQNETQVEKANWKNAGLSFHHRSGGGSA